MAGRFLGSPEIPDGMMTDWQTALFSSLKENVELLTGTRGEADLASRAIVRGDLTAKQVGQQEMTTVSARGSGYVLGTSERVAGLDDYAKLVADVQRLANDLNITRQTLDLLIRQMRGL